MLKIHLKIIYERPLWLNIIFAIFGVIFIGVGSGVNFCANLGNDPSSVLVAGLSTRLNLSLGISVYILTGVMLVISLIFGKKNKNIGLGTVFYIIATGKIINSTVNLYNGLMPYQNLLSKVLSALFGCFIMIFGAALLASSNTGADAWTAAAMSISDTLHKDFKKVKVIFDAITCFLGFILGGKIGIVTALVALFGGPIMKFMLKKLEKVGI